MRRAENEIRLHHHYIGEIKNEIVLPKCDEGELHWVDKKDILDLPMTASGKEALRHWITTPDSDRIFLVAVNAEADSAVVSEI